MNWRFAIPLVVVIALVAAFWRGLFLNPGEVPSPLIGKPTPAFSLPGLYESSDTFSNDDLQGKISLVNVFGTWCPGCHDEHPLLIEWAKSPPYGVPIYGINWAKHQPGEREAAIAWLQRVGDPYAAIGHDANGEVIMDWGIYGAPETFLVDSAGRVRLKHVGVLTPQVLQEKIIPAIELLRAEETR
ncbi:MAG: DsbE family thiol:disulfide interchange protein [Proteobacteria bacterium]|nr:DsbE family thiol:disulfide interchange protein [Pseudomonadota bacterium]